MEVLKPEFLHSYFFGIAEGDERGLRPLRESCAAVGRLLQMFLDIIVSTIFEALRMETTNNEEVVTVGRVEDLLSRAGKGKGGNSACICNLKDGLLSVERELCVSALMGDDEGVTCTESADGETSGPHFDASRLLCSATWNTTISCTPMRTKKCETSLLYFARTLRCVMIVGETVARHRERFSYSMAAQARCELLQSGRMLLGWTDPNQAV
ncbi:hypothetical protein DPX39_040068500 [Trypanosoma brucei equiperdum]|uniref:Uncharacterized protein n=1 Tax=Trypanosoma brucei equiperdum TaxID=630700 RepID=A0A3L6L9R8_9TRYP|nr:hypothetical protein DPX39_040068500 [Trypanosoma brucei equiperdum]